jgi:glycosyltransferase involved in cell wall biosynthesis
MPKHFDSVTLLVTHYNRSSSLERLLKSFEHLECSFGGIVISDDGSKSEHLSRLEQIKEEYRFDLITTLQNRGLGNNINKGQDTVRTPYTLYVQEDFVPTPLFPEKFEVALRAMEECAELDLVRFYSYLKYPYLKPYKAGFSEMLIKPWGLDYTKIYFYSDHPHLRRSSCFEKFGRYPEGLKGDRTEYLMCVSWIRNNAKGLFYNDFKALFDQRNSEEEPSTMTRSNWRQSSNVLIAAVRDIYRQLKYNYDLNK